jgi:ribosomal protein L21
MLPSCGRCVAAFPLKPFDRRPSVFAVISLGGKQYRVRKGEYLTVDRLAHEPGSTFSPPVLLASSDADVLIDADALAKVTVTARVDEHLLGPKIRVFQYKPKKSTKKARGHRSRLSRITIEDIAVGAPKKAAAAMDATKGSVRRGRFILESVRVGLWARPSWFRYPRPALDSPANSANARNIAGSRATGSGLRRPPPGLGPRRETGGRFLYLRSMSGNPRAPELNPDFAWLNTDRPLTFAQDLKGQVVLLDFWTYCCINCMHVLPDLAYLEEKYRDEPFIVIGVHSAKFENEGHRQTVRAAIGRYEIHHPVVVDEGMSIWSEYAVRSWPTLVLVGADRKIVGVVAGEGNRDTLDQAIAGALAAGRAAGVLAPGPLKLEREGTVRPATGLAFPGKVLADPAGGRLFIADSNHSRVVVATLPDAGGRSRVTRLIGSGSVGQDDGPAERATFHHPQGLALMDRTLLVADTENHLLRAVDLEYKIA